MHRHRDRGDRVPVPRQGPLPLTVAPPPRSVPTSPHASKSTTNNRHTNAPAVRAESRSLETRRNPGVLVQRNRCRPKPDRRHLAGVALCCARGARTGLMRRKTKARKRARAQRQTLIEARRRRAQTAAARAAHSARTNPTIRAHDALVLPTILRLRGEGLSWARVAQELDGLFEPPGWARPLPGGDHGLGEPVRPGLAAVEHAGRALLHGRSRRGPGPAWQA